MGEGGVLVTYVERTAGFGPAARCAPADHSRNRRVWQAIGHKPNVGSHCWHEGTSFHLNRQRTEIGYPPLSPRSDGAKCPASRRSNNGTTSCRALAAAGSST